MMSDYLQLATSGRIAAAVEQIRTDGVTATDQLNQRLLMADLELSRSGGCSTHQTGATVQRIAIVSLLFNWPSTGGGIVHTTELAKFLTLAGYDVCHFYAQFSAWEMGDVQSTLPYPARPITFDESTWQRDGIIHAFRQAVAEFLPDAVIVTDSWNTKPMLATAVSDYPYFLRLAALECLCPLNNVRLISGDGGRPIQCHESQLATRAKCLSCVQRNQHASGPLHVAERALALFEDPQYEYELKSAFANATGVLAVNPLIGTLCEPYTNRVHVIPSGFDAERFKDLPDISWIERPFRLLFAGLVEEYMKGFHVLMEACQMLWSRRQDFELHVTADAGHYDAPFLRFRGWQDQASLPALMAECHAAVVPTVAQEALGRTAVEAMGAGRPVIASRIGGLPFTIIEGFTGLLAKPADPADLARCCETLIDNPALATKLGEQGRQQFLAKHTWERVIAELYRPLFAEFAR